MEHGNIKRLMKKRLDGFENRRVLLSVVVKMISAVMVKISHFCRGL
jgi:hypothetical protein